MAERKPKPKLDRIMDDWFTDEGVDDADVRWLIDSLMKLRDASVAIRNYTSKGRPIPAGVMLKFGDALNEATKADA